MTLTITQVRGRARRAGRFASALAVAVVMSACAAGGSTDSRPSGARDVAVVEDTAVSGRVQAALIADPLTQAHQIAVETHRGVVQLSGFVDTAEQRARATAVARAIAGVREVNNELDLRTR